MNNNTTTLLILGGVGLYLALRNGQSTAPTLNGCLTFAQAEQLFAQQLAEAGINLPTGLSTVLSIAGEQIPGCITSAWVDRIVGVAVAIYGAV